MMILIDHEPFVIQSQDGEEMIARSVQEPERTVKVTCRKGRWYVSGREIFNVLI